MGWYVRKDESREADGVNTRERAFEIKLHQMLACAATANRVIAGLVITEQEESWQTYLWQREPAC